MARLGMAVLIVTFVGCSAAMGPDMRGDYADGDADGDADHGGVESEGGDADSDTDADACDAARAEPSQVWMSADDSNSQADPAWVRAIIQSGGTIDGSLRLYEFLNYYDFDYGGAQPGHVSVIPELRAHDDPADGYSMLVGVVSPSMEILPRRPLAITFSLDTSGSMEGGAIERVKDVLRATASSLVLGDVVSIVAWSSITTIVLESEHVSGPNDPEILAAIETIHTDGSTNFQGGLIEAYRLALENYQPQGLNRVVLISDGGANTGETDIDLIAQNADLAEGEGIYLVGVGTSSSTWSYRDDLMNAVTDAGKGAYLYVDSKEEADRMFRGTRFLQNLELYARDVRLAVTLPGGWAIEEFHGEQISENREDIEPQHLSPHDAMLYHFDLLDCSADSLDEVFSFRAEWKDETGAQFADEATASVADLVAAQTRHAQKADAVVAYAKALTEVWSQPDGGAYLDGVMDQVRAAQSASPEDPDLAEILGLLETYRAHFE